VIQLGDERNLVSVAASHVSEHTEGGGNGAASAFDGEFEDPFRVEHAGVRREAGAGGVLDPLVDG